MLPGSDMAPSRPTFSIWTMALVAAFGCGGPGDGSISNPITGSGTSSGTAPEAGAPTSTDAGTEGSANTPSPEGPQSEPAGTCLYFDENDRPRVFLNGDTWSCPEAEFAGVSGGSCRGFCECVDGTTTLTFPEGGSSLTPYGCGGSGASGGGAAFDDAEAGGHGSSR
jgi:hypothetical protein